MIELQRRQDQNAGESAPGLTLRGRSAALGRRVSGLPPVRMLRLLIEEIAADDIFGMAAEMAYNFLFAMFPLLLLLATTLGFAGSSFGLENLFAGALRRAAPLLPAEVFHFLEGYSAGLLETRSPAFFTVGLAGALWGAAGAARTLIKGLDRAYEVAAPRGFWRQQLVALLVTMLIPPAVLALLGLGVAGDALAEWLGALTGLTHPLTILLATARWPLLALSLILGLSLVYHKMPNSRHDYRWSLPGRVFAAVCWMILTQTFGFYIDNFGHYDVTYGSFGAVIAFLLWLYFAGAMVLVGAEINALFEPAQRGRWRRHLGEPRSSPPQSRHRPDGPLQNAAGSDPNEESVMTSGPSVR